MINRDYQYLVEVAKCGSISTAASNLFLTPSTISKAVQKVEAEFGLPLFFREGRHMIPTEAGKIFLAEASGILRRQMDLEQKMHSMSVQNNNSLRVGCLMDLDLTGAVLDFQKKFPEVQVSLWETTGERLWELIGNREINLMVCEINPDDLDEQQFTPLCSTCMVIVVARNHPLVKKAVWMEGRNYPAVSLRECLSYPLISPSPQQRLWRGVQNGFEWNSIPVPPVYAYATSPKSIFRLVSQTNGFTLAFDRSAQEYVNQMNLSLLAVRECQAIRSCAVCCQYDHTLTEVEKGFIESCKKTF